MRTSILLFSFFSFVTLSSSFGQWSTSGGLSTSTLTTGGKVGIKTSSPIGIFDIRLGGWNNMPLISFNQFSNNPNISFYRPTGNTTSSYPWHIRVDETGNLNFMSGSPAQAGSEVVTQKVYFSRYGNVGIGTTNPSSGLEVKSPDGGIHISDHGSSNFLQVGGRNIVSGKGFVFKSTTNHTASKQFSLFVSDGSSQQERLTILRDGNVGIGTTNPGSFKLAVEGKIGAREIQVTTVPWADFVFLKEYRLRPLYEVEEFINENGHLPEIPSAKEVEENGINLGEMDAKLLQKIEELTLYMIELKKENEAMKEENMEIKKAIVELTAN